MDHESFDRLTRLISASGSRRAMLGSLLGILLASTQLPSAGARRRVSGKTKGRRTGKDHVSAHAKHRGRAKDSKAKDRRGVARTRNKARNEARRSRCCATGNCAPGPGKNLAKCCYTDQHLAGKNFKGANLTAANFSGADLTNSSFKAANVRNACFVDADLTGATFTGANTSGAIFCRTQTDTGEDNSGCERGTRCCPTCGAAGQACCAGDACAAGLACVDDICGSCGGDDEPCCAGRVCDGALLCDASGTCVPCGRKGVACCSGGGGPGACDANLICREDVCIPCGGDHEPCCASGPNLGCAAGLACRFGGTCVPCGALDQSCCFADEDDPGICDGELLCGEGGFCAACGAISVPCCPDGTCNGNLVCNGGTCDVDAGECVEGDSSTCHDETPICVQSECVACTSDQQCIDAGKGTRCCGGQCRTVQCCDNGECESQNPAKPICRPASQQDQFCTGCDFDPAQCGAGRSCCPDGSCAVGECCVSSQCTAVAAPICTSNACEACTADQQCIDAGKGSRCCGGQCRTVQCCDNSECQNPTPICRPASQQDQFCTGCDFDPAQCGEGTTCCADGSCLVACPV
jgi:hypothetical protein